MASSNRKTRCTIKPDGERGFTIPEVIVAGSIMIIIAVGVLTAYVQAIKLNRGNELRMQALSVLQQEVEFYRSLKFIPVGSDAAIAGGSYPRPNRTSASGRVFSINVTIDNFPFDGNLDNDETTTTFKEITIVATPLVAENEGWLQDLNTRVTVQRVRSN